MALSTNGRGDTERRSVGRPDAVSRWAPRLLPLFVAWYVTISPLLIRGGVITGIAGLLALPLVFVAARHLERTLLVLVVVLPFHHLLLSWLYSMGLHVELARNLRYWRDLAIVAVLLGVLTRRAETRRRMDALDRVCLAYVAVVAIYAIVPHLFAPDAPMNLNTRLSGWRQNAGFVLILFAVRRAPLAEDFRDRFVRAVLIVTAIVGAVGVFEFFRSSTWNDWMVRTFEVPRYNFDVLQSPIGRPHDIRFYGMVGDREIIRIGSVLLSPLKLPFYLLPGFVLGIEQLLRGTRSTLAAVATILSGCAIVFTQTRSGVLAAVVALALALRLKPRHADDRRARLTLLLAGALIVSVPIAAAIGLVDRVQGGGDAGSSEQHGTQTALGWSALLDQPLGLGLGTAAGAGQRYGERTLVAENSYLQIGNETGVFALAVFVVLMVLLARKLWPLARTRDDPLTVAVTCSLAGFAVGSWLLQPFVELAVSWQYFIAAGVVLALTEHAPASERHVEGTSSEPSAHARAR